MCTVQVRGKQSYQVRHNAQKVQKLHRHNTSDNRHDIADIARRQAPEMHGSDAYDAFLADEPVSSEFRNKQPENFVFSFSRFPSICFIGFWFILIILFVMFLGYFRCFFSLKKSQF